MENPFTKTLYVKTQSYNVFDCDFKKYLQYFYDSEW